MSTRGPGDLARISADTGERDAWIRRLCRQGATREELASRFGLSLSRVLDITAGCMVSCRSTSMAERDAEIRHLSSQGLSAPQIAKVVGLSRSRILDILRKDREPEPVRKRTPTLTPSGHVERATREAEALATELADTPYRAHLDGCIHRLTDEPTYQGLREIEHCMDEARRYYGVAA